MLNGKIPSLLGVMLLLVQVFVGSTLIQNKRIQSIAAKEISTPKDVKISNVDGNSFTVSWITDKKTVGEVVWNKADKSPKFRAPLNNDEKTYTHSVTIRNLEEKTLYTFNIASDNFEYTNNNVSWTAKTGPSLPIPDAVSISGKIFFDNNIPAANTLVYATVNGSSLMSAITGPNGDWAIPISDARDKNLSSHVTIQKDKTPIEIYIQAGKNQVAYARTTFSGAVEIPHILIGQIYEFNNKEPENAYIVPDAEINLSQEI